jgi:hypothetical protein
MLLAAAFSVGLIAQSPERPVPPKPQAAPAPAAASSQQMPAVQLRVQVTIMRYSGDKKIASLPFTLWVNANDEPTTLNAGQSVPIPSPHFVSGGAANAPPISYTFQPVGTRITCQGTATADGRFKLTLGIRDSYPAPAKTSGEIVSLKSLETHNSLVLRSGQTAEFVAVTDMISGDVTRIEVTATVLK